MRHKKNSRNSHNNIRHAARKLPKKFYLSSLSTIKEHPYKTLSVVTASVGLISSVLLLLRWNRH